MLCSVKTDEGNDGSASSLSGHLKHTFVCPLRQVPIRSMQRVLVANTKHLVQECKHAVEHSRRETKNVECANVLLCFILRAYECCMRKLIYEHF